MKCEEIRPTVEILSLACSTSPCTTRHPLSGASAGDVIGWVMEVLLDHLRTRMKVQYSLRHRIVLSPLSGKVFDKLKEVPYLNSLSKPSKNIAFVASFGTRRKAYFGHCTKSHG